VRAFYVGPSALFRSMGPVTQAFGLGWDVAAPLALNPRQKQIPCGNGRQEKQKQKQEQEQRQEQKQEQRPVGPLLFGFGLRGGLLVIACGR